MKPSMFIRRIPLAARLVVLLSCVLLTGLAARADVIYTLNATAQSGELFTGTLTIPIPNPSPYPEFTDFTGLITQTTATGTVIDTYVPNESDVEGSVRRFYLEGTGQNGRINDALLIYVEGSDFASNLTVCTIASVCVCVPAATCPYPAPASTISDASACTAVDNGHGYCLTVDEQVFQTASLTGISTAVTPEPSSLLLLATGVLALPTLMRSGRRRLALLRKAPGSVT